ncbi:ADP-dependent NAD(P)H-hydrate dehydratase [Aeropyrum camini]|uniref:ADP-dependent NAD(P)H-hydrate dehydratase n=1 Tax=Aeropyrum camini TaxID=229980 RepID=UPI000786B4D4|nr:NAD(P)H-hydrate dehydratase [Aeropyrum camini]
MLTPHRGEAKLLLGGEDLPPLKAAREIAARYGATTVVKAPVDAVCTPEGRCRESPWGAPEMSVGGTGDVLAGVIAGFLARRRALGLPPDPLNTAAAALYTVGRAGEVLVAEEGWCIPQG